MPDGDCLNWKLRGPGSRILVDLARSGADPLLLVDQGVRSFTCHLNERQVDRYLHEVAECVYSASQKMSSVDVSESLRSELRILESQFGTAEGAITTGAAERVFLRFREERGSPTLETVQEECLTECAKRLIEEHALLPAREILRREGGRDTAEQLKWEARLLEDIGERTRRMRQSVFDPSGKPIRAPKRQFEPRATTMESLHEPVPTLGP